MATQLIQDSLNEALRTAFLVGLPALAAVTLGSVIAVLLEKSLGMRDQSLEFAFRIIALAGVLVGFGDRCMALVYSLAELSWR
jgi:type III secretory pathway component EscS